MVLGVRAAVKLSDGTWADADARLGAEGVTAFNVAPNVAEFRDLSVELPSVPKPAVSEEALEGMPWREALEPALGGRITLRVELLALNGRSFADEITIPARTA